MAEHLVADDELIAYAAGTAPEPRRAEIAHQVAACAACATTIATYQAVRESVRWDAVESPSAASISKLKGLMPLASPAIREASVLVDATRRVVANLVFDGRQPAAAVGLRGAADAYTLVYAADDADVDLHVEPPLPGRDHWQVTGQVSLPGERVEAKVELSSDESPAIWTDVDETGMFSLVAAPGTYDVVVRLADRELLLSNVRIR